MRERFRKHKKLLICLAIVIAVLIPLGSVLATGALDFGAFLRPVNDSKTYDAYKIEVERAAVPPVTNLHPIHVYYYQDSTSGFYLGMTTLPGAAEGTIITGVDRTLYAPLGYMTPGTVSGATVVAPGDNYVYVVYTMPAVPVYQIIVLYTKDSISGDNLGTEFLPSAPAGTPITGVDPTLHAPAGYTTPGTVTGATVVAAGV
ncbi:MAG: hypothetical protein LBH28_11230, partial [Oscillospiraceae bacterium]|nr:hypothetical protein [Oscillospiraceae bacterium]